MKLDCASFLSHFRASAPGSAVLLDVRNDDEVAGGILPNAVHIPLGTLAVRALELPRDKAIYVYCGSGLRAEKARDVLVNIGFPHVVVASGGGYIQLAGG